MLVDNLSDDIAAFYRSEEPDIQKLKDRESKSVYLTHPTLIKFRNVPIQCTVDFIYI